VHAFSHDQVRLLVLDQLQPRAEIPDLLLNGRGLLVVLDVQYTVDVEAAVSGCAKESDDGDLKQEEDDR